MIKEEVRITVSQVVDVFEWVVLWWDFLLAMQAKVVIVNKAVFGFWVTFSVDGSWAVATFCNALTNTDVFLAATTYLLLQNTLNHWTKLG